MINNDQQTIMAERCEITSRHKNEKKEWRIVRVNTESWRREHSCALPRLTSMAEADSDKARVSRIVQLLENGGRADSRLRVGLWGGRWERDRAHTAQYGGVAAAQRHCRAARLDKLRIPSRHGAMRSCCDIAQANDRLSLTRRSRINQLCRCWILAALSMF